MRVRLAQIEDADLRLFDFDLDLTFMVFFMNADEQIYGRFGGRDAESPDSRQSLVGLHYAMKAALETHRKQGVAAQSERNEPLSIRDLMRRRSFSGCVHCHQAKEMLDNRLKQDGQWTAESIWRYPLPDNLGLILEVDRGDVIKRVVPDSPAAELGLKSGDVILRIAGVDVRSFADAQYALDRAPTKGTTDVVWHRDGQPLTGPLTLPDGWRRTDISWRPSMQDLVPSARLYGRDLTAEERSKHGLSATQLAFWQKYPVHSQAQAAGIREEDIILGFDGKAPDIDAYEFLRHVRANYVVGDRVIVDVLREDKRLRLPMILQSFNTR